jgi:hypothetical protein
MYYALPNIVFLACTYIFIYACLHALCLFLNAFFFILAELSSDQILNLRRREALAYESDVFEQAAKDIQTDVNRQEKLDLQLRQLRKMILHVKVTSEASAADD